MRGFFLPYQWIKNANRSTCDRHLFRVIDGIVKISHMQLYFASKLPLLFAKFGSLDGYEKNLYSKFNIIDSMPLQNLDTFAILHNVFPTTLPMTFEANVRQNI